MGPPWTRPPARGQNTHQKKPHTQKNTPKQVKNQKNVGGGGGGGWFGGVGGSNEPQRGCECVLHLLPSGKKDTLRIDDKSRQSETESLHAGNRKGVGRRSAPKTRSEREPRCFRKKIKRGGEPSELIVAAK